MVCKGLRAAGLLPLYLFIGVASKIVLMHAHWGHAIRHTIHGTDALFGFPVFGDFVSGTVAQAGNGCKPVPDGTWDRKIVLALRGGGCSYLQKVLHAQRGGALAVMVGDTVEEPASELPVMSDELESGGDKVLIPSMFITKEDVDYIQEHLAKMADAKVESDIGLMTASMSWDFQPKGRGEKVHWEFWSSSFDPHAFDLKRGGMWARQSVLDDLSLFAVALAPAARFTPHYYVVPGKLWQCTTARHGKPFDVRSPHCGRQCSNSGRYCVVDRSGASELGFDGIDIISENVRQLCANSGRNAGHPKRWWKYVVGFAKQCSKAKSPQGCSKRLMSEVGIDAAAVEACVAESGGTAMGGDMNKLLEAQLIKQELEKIERPPKLIINGQHFVGRLDCPAPILPSRCPPLGAICSAFSLAHKPKACSDGYWDGKNAWSPMVGSPDWMKGAATQVHAKRKSHAKLSLLPDIVLKTAAGDKIDCDKVKSHCAGPMAKSTKTNPGSAHWHTVCKQAYGLCSVAEMTEAAFQMTGADPETQIVGGRAGAVAAQSHSTRGGYYDADRAAAVAGGGRRSGDSGGGNGGTFVWVVIICVLGAGAAMSQSSGGSTIYAPLPSSMAYDTIQGGGSLGSSGSSSEAERRGSDSGGAGVYTRRPVKSGKAAWLED